MAHVHNLSSVNFFSLKGHLQSYPQKNMHTRDTHVKKGKRYVKYCNLVRLKNKDLIECHLSGDSVDIRYDVSYNSGNPRFSILSSTEPIAEANRILAREFDRMIKRAASEAKAKNRKYPVNYKKDTYYIQRNNKKANQPEAFSLAKKNRVFHPSFYKNVVDWGFKIIIGHKA